MDELKALDAIVDSLIRDPRLAWLGGLSKSLAVVAELIAQDLSNKEIGRYLGVAEDGARVLVTKVLEKLDAQTRPEAILAWQRLKDEVLRGAARGNGPAGNS